MNSTLSANRPYSIINKELDFKSPASPSIPDNYDATKYRRWVRLGPSPADSKNKISVMSYNLLSRHYTWHEVFGYLEQQYLDWPNYRFPLINMTISQFKCDIMCFQEMEYYVYDKYWSKNFPDSNYKSFFVKKSLPGYWGGKSNDFIDGVGVFVNTKRFDVVETKEINFGEHVLENKSQYQMTEDLIARLIPRNTVALILKLHDKIADKTVYVANTHLYWSPQYNDVKALQTKLLLNELRDYVDGNDLTKAHIIVMGDLNSNLKSDVFKLLSTDGIDVKESPEFSGHDYGVNNPLIDENGIIDNPFEFANIYDCLIKTEKLNFTSYTSSLTDVLDHIFITKNGFDIVKVLSEVDEKYCSNCPIKGFPNKQFPSDHIPLVAEINYT
ncbi:glucose-repressible alcohol dehydrogenase transcriptional effector [Spathaspora passalidarum NRRL Y-27907]|uniref:Glucose-repressible alcohol dehydrogenase transcriptional effector n=1 Tax=Spathaspora passalidarum (strain NRRL Y-27907 / 11-Y1) TaxID=619300 RepID=G3APX7_SPAPN|nr:glucose-repressible alcohol dehydrogenase transcriptional effector [Spathaspora passalidarum NRRL Y-27907]EGW32299.1 glucose-repressible alcohol dehydrogenase transcriptional effector [Spathaspora passalidarum NRRL Y-27907]